MPSSSRYPYQLTPKQKKFADELLTGNSINGAAKVAYDATNKDSNSSIGHKTLALSNVQAYINFRCYREGLIDAPLDAYKEAFGAIKIIRDRNGKEVARDPDWSSRLHAADSIVRILGIGRIKNGSAGNGQHGDTINITPETELTEEEYWNIKFVAANDGQIPNKRELAAFRKKYELQEATEEGGRVKGSAS
jgi:hypothetical protein